MEYLSNSKTETYKIAAKIAKELKGGEILALSGDLGSGKTTFVQGLAAALGIKNQVTSPTFVLLKKYKVESSKLKIKSLIHVDAYRMESEKDAESIGLSEYLNDKKNLVVIEWPEKIIKIFPDGKKLVKFKYVDENTRKITIS
jgi:tRNA threonylcarbamoyladenosine biosynthesis protein TsaE